MLAAATGMLSLGAPAPAVAEVDTRLAAFGAPIVHKFDAWKVSMGKSYATPAAERAALEAFESNERIINTHNGKGNSSYTLGHNEFSDMTWDTFRTTVMSELYLNRPRKNAREVHLTGDEACIGRWLAQSATCPMCRAAHQ